MKIPATPSMDLLAAMMERGARSRMEGDLDDAQANARGFDAVRVKARDRLEVLNRHADELRPRAEDTGGFFGTIAAAFYTSEAERAGQDLLWNGIETERTSRQLARARDDLASEQDRAKEALGDFSGQQRGLADLRAEIADTRSLLSQV